MQTTTRLLLPFTKGISALALDYAVQLATQRSSMLVPLALIPVKSGGGARLEHIQQAQDFLVFIQRKAKRQGVPVDLAQIYTHDAACSIEAFASEMSCEAVILFLSNTGEVLLGHTEIRALMDRSICNMHIVLMPDKYGHKESNHPLHVPLLKCTNEEMEEPKTDTLLLEGRQEQASFIRRIFDAHSH